MWRMGFLGIISEVCIIALNLVANTIGTNLKQGILVYRYTFQHFFYKIHQIILKTWIYHSTGDCDTNHCSCRGHGVGCTDYCNCDLGICQNTDGSPSALINEDLDNEYIRKFLVQKCAFSWIHLNKKVSKRIKFLKMTQISSISK